MAIQDDTSGAGEPKQKKLQLHPINSNTPAATTNVGVPTNAQELDELRQKINTINGGGAQAPATHTQEPIRQQQNTHINHHQNQPSDQQAALGIVRNKVAKLYASEPDATEEAIESFAIKNRSKHQQYMHDLTTSGMGLAEIQTAWHTYYTGLPDSDKHQVWQEFYQAHDQHAQTSSILSEPAHHNTQQTQPHHTKFEPGASKQTRTVADIKQTIHNKVSAGGKLKLKHHIQSLLFGFGVASMFVALLLFSFFNERFIAPFISPSRQVSATPIVGNSNIVGPEPKIIIPKINLEVPVVYDLNTTEEKSVQAGLERGVVHYSTSPIPGEAGNVVIVGHSSNNILNKGQYKFAFVLLKKLEIGDTFFLNKDGIRYTYQIFDKKIVKPTDVSVLGASTKPNTATLITCDPPGTSLNRLVVVAEQISPDPTGNKATEVKTPTLTDKGILPSNAPSLWQRFLNIF